MILETVPPSLRGELSRWLIEIKSGIFIGSVSALVRDQLWELCGQKIKKGGMWQIYHSNNEQGFNMRQFGNTGKVIVDLEGVSFVKTLFS
ncbi:MAG: type I-E CRISPR-associated endoribonuclease Cas2e [Ignavibacteriales bacterium]|nr:type I-E CRISPR-associated endoribonuclease Cas2e [Ignavibacteriales bacterium]MCF8315329.1 type I-E CRISPR-associated endoribonuclease Cas2e [Ignavibacteriales bacterium]MCF8436779.1 type I-E CRISPR-associated endoribonuclease Cas2e [Ignavibacteriales bacterium]